MASPPPPMFGLIGLGVMGSNLALNVAEHGFPTAVWNLEQVRTQEFLEKEARGFPITGAATLEMLVERLERPRRIFLMIKAGEPVDQVLRQLVPLLEPGDIVMDGGNSHYEDTRRREAELRDNGLHFVGVGVSGGEEGARHGPSLMPGGSAEAYRKVAPIFEAIAARSDSGACVTHVGPDGAGHFVKMVHNGIEYADMQLLAEAYDLMGRGLALDAGRQSEIFARWNQGPLASFLVEITAAVLKVKDPDTGLPLVDRILDRAGQKGTGRWTAQVALELAVPVPTIAAAIDARVLSSRKDARLAASQQMPKPGRARTDLGGDEAIAALHDALLGARICCYAQGMDLIATASDTFGWQVDLREIARIWKAGCIIRARLLDDLMKVFEQQPRVAHLLVAPDLSAPLARADAAWRRILAAGAALAIPLPALSSALWYADSYRSERLPQNLTQAQRDAFGAHTYERWDRPGEGPFHTEWL